MNLEEKKEGLKRDIKKYTEWLKPLEKELTKLENSTQPKTVDLFNGIETFFNVKVENREYENILGGDGRSAPWSEQKIGQVATVTLKKDIYLNDKQKSTVKEYIYDKYTPDHIDIK